ncbi:hypothetical protein FRC14_001697 [Serendipita sp. 396]|nr:hypothetical protein FRC14_001697 [Serendipita sp. 396]KAG8785561.1 hypothetical protein FRC15_001119 [Serendipita sp. 397]KAG8811977.1 hypothetical protein FRC19_003467 [Serendipita sp. 401]KAG8850200.1 hypothetical protein FRB91_009279 [Serendipita sp. 411]KAG8870889.1 hypothetical protein FRC20_011178 [Serendipita sp. 405]KAG9044931.1 hypothetical protein FS842_001355 [Serendipita sp. 407]
MSFLAAYYVVLKRMEAHPLEDVVLVKRSDAWAVVGKTLYNSLKLPIPPSTSDPTAIFLFVQQDDILARLNVSIWETIKADPNFKIAYWKYDPQPVQPAPTPTPTPTPTPSSPSASTRESSNTRDVQGFW